MFEQAFAGGTVYGLWHPGSAELFSGFGLRPEPERPELLVGLLLVDRPEPVAPAWLARVEQTFGDYLLVPLTATHERGLACHMVIEERSLPFVRQLEAERAQPLADTLRPLLAERPKPYLRLHWDETHRLWLSEFAENERQSAEPALPRPLFPLGDLLITPGALAALLVAGQTPVEFLVRHVCGDWGDLCPEDVHANVRALSHGSRLFSAYSTADGVRLWVITEWDRSVTTLLLPSEY